MDVTVLLTVSYCQLEREDPMPDESRSVMDLFRQGGVDEFEKLFRLQRPRISVDTAGLGFSALRTGSQVSLNPAGPRDLATRTGIGKGGPVMFTFFRALIYASLFIGFLFVYLPARLLSWTGIARPAAFTWMQFAGAAICAAGAFIALWCVGTFIFVGRGTPAPFDPPRRLVLHGPYRFVRNPMYIGAALALGGAALFYKSIPLLLYGCGLLALSHMIVVFYEEPALRKAFGTEYDAYRHNVRRWLPGLKAAR
jgi:protein-S-isoprenylcysteine O-methyltransferase Ste14